MSETTSNSGPDWVKDETICPCGEKAGPDFRYGLCDKHAHEVPPEALLRWGASVGRLYKRIGELETENRIVKEQRSRLIRIARLASDPKSALAVIASGG